MNRKKENRMLRRASAVAALAAAVFVAGGCDMNISNPNAPDAARAFQDPAGLAQLLGGAFQQWVDTRGNYNIMAMNMMANSFTASWNNAAIRLYSSEGADCPVRCGWNNDATATETAGGPAVEDSWYGYYTVMSSGNDVMAAINSGTCFDEDCSNDNTLTTRNQAIAEMLQGMALAGIAIQYDQGFIVDENTDLSQILTMSFSTRAEMRDAALTKFEAAYADAGKATWNTDATWMGVGAGTTYSNKQIQQVIRTMEAELIAMWPRNGTENAAADWASVASYASQGISSGAPFNFQYYIDTGNRECGLDCVKNWGNSMATVRVDTYTAHILSTNHVDPWPDPDGNPCPLVAGFWGVTDKRVGDGTWGPSDDYNGLGTTAATANAGTDYACLTSAIFPPARGQYHQSNMQFVRYHYLAYRGEDLPGDDATGQDPMYTTQMNDLLWAEGLIRSGGSMATAAQKINNSRVNRGGLPALTGSETTAQMLTALEYEQDIEFMGQGSDPFWIRRRTDGGTINGGKWFAGTPRQMPVPAKELQILLKEIYTFGGPDHPDMSVQGNLAGSAGSSSSSGVQSVRQILSQLRARARAEARKRF
jgi:hypothetical protein